MNVMEKAECQEAYEKNQEVDCRDSLLHTEKIDLILREERVGGRAKVITDESRLLRGS